MASGEAQFPTRFRRVCEALNSSITLDLTRCGNIGELLKTCQRASRLLQTPG